jgi:hypothetical protein
MEQVEASVAEVVIGLEAANFERRRVKVDFPQFPPPNAVSLLC